MPTLEPSITRSAAERARKAQVICLFANFRVVLLVYASKKFEFLCWSSLSLYRNSRSVSVSVCSMNHRQVLTATVTPDLAPFPMMS